MAVQLLEGEVIIPTTRKHTAAMAQFNGKFKLDKSEKFDEFMAAMGELMSRTGTQNDDELRSFIALVKLPMMEIFESGKILPVYRRIPSLSVEILLYLEDGRNCLTSSDPFL